jgi:hypothetical protein
MQRLFRFTAVAFLLSIAGLTFAQQPEPLGTPDTDITIDVERAAENVVGLSEDIARTTVGTLTDILEQILVAPRSQAARILLVLGGVLLLLAGWRIYEFVIIIAGILIGASIGSAVFADSDQFLQIIGFVLGGFLGAVLAALLYYVAVFFIGAYVGVVLTAAIAASLGYEQLHPLIILLAAIIGGVILLGLSSELLIFLAALVGAQMVTLGLGLEPLWMWTLLLTLLGIILQVMLARSAGYDIRRPPRRRSWLFRRT